jgi:hypothetical protein
MSKKVKRVGLFSGKRVLVYCLVLCVVILIFSLGFFKYQKFKLNKNVLFEDIFLDPGQIGFFDYSTNESYHYFNGTIFNSNDFTVDCSIILKNSGSGDSRVESFGLGEIVPFGRKNFSLLFQPLEGESEISFERVCS